LPFREWFSAGADSCALSAHKLGAFGGIGALVLRRGRRFRPFIRGGAQEKNRRAGTENLPGIVSFGIAAQELLRDEHWNGVARVDKFRQDFYVDISRFPSITLNSPPLKAVYNTCNFSIPKGGEDLLLKLDMEGICASSGSACSSGANLPSSVLLAMGRDEVTAKNAVRFSFSVNTTQDEIEKVRGVLKEILGYGV